MKEILLLKDGEIVLKGLNRRQFEDILKKNVKIAATSSSFPNFVIAVTMPQW